MHKLREKKKARATSQVSHVDQFFFGKLIFGSTIKRVYLLVNMDWRVHLFSREFPFTFVVNCKHEMLEFTD